MPLRLQLRSIPTLAPFLYPCRSNKLYSISLYTTSTSEFVPDPEDYTSSPFIDARPLTLLSGSGGHGCVSFLREKYIAQGPPNGGDGGVGGSIYIQAVYGESVSLHKLARGVVRAGNGRHGMGKSRNGARGEDVVLRVPVGTVVREIERGDPNDYETAGGPPDWVHYPLHENENMNSYGFAKAIWPKRHFETARDRLQALHPTPIYLDLDKPMPEPVLLLPGAPGGLGNPHFVTQSLRGPKFATKGAKGLSMKITLELKLLADVGLVGLPNAGKSSFLRAVSRKKARVGNWAFTTLSPNLGTVMLPADKSFTVADIPGLIADAHMNKGLGLDFLRHVERAKVLAFVLDLQNDPVGDLISLWKELVAYEEGWEVQKGGMMGEMMGDVSESGTSQLSIVEEASGTALFSTPASADQGGMEGESPKASREASSNYIEESLDEVCDDTWEEEEEDEVAYPDSRDISAAVPKVEEEEKAVWKTIQAFVPNKVQSATYDPCKPLPEVRREKITTKPFLIIANKADLVTSQENYRKLKEFLRTVRDNKDPHVGIQGMKRAIEKGLEGADPAVYPICAKEGGGVESVVESLRNLLRL